MLPKISQGVTTVVVGNCGISLAPLVRADVPPPLNLLGGGDKYVYPTMAAYVAAVDAARPAVNVAALVGHSTLRVATMDDPYRPATRAEQARMVRAAARGAGRRRDRPVLGRVLRHRRRRRHRRAGAARRHRRATRAASTRRTSATRWTQVLDSLDEAFADRAARQRAGRHLASQVRRARQLGPHRADAGAHRRRARAAADRPRLPTRTSPARPCCAATWSTASSTSSSPGRRRIPRWRRASGRHRRRVGLHAAGGLRAAAARRRLLLPDARGRRAARAALSGDDDRLRRPAARPASASAPVGHVSARARPLQPRPRPLPARDRRAQDDRRCRARRFKLAERGELRAGCFADVVGVRSGDRAATPPRSSSRRRRPRHRARAGQRRGHLPRRQGDRAARRTLPAVAPEPDADGASPRVVGPARRPLHAHAPCAAKCRRARWSRRAARRRMHRRESAAARRWRGRRPAARRDGS